MPAQLGLGMAALGRPGYVRYRIHSVTAESKALEDNAVIDAVAR